MESVHGLNYPQPFLAALPVVLPRPAPHQPVRAIDATHFADIHLAHFTSDVPDSILFPFLHGLEGDNTAQNTFFAGSGGLSKSDDDAARAKTVSVPRYRGLIWVACDDEDSSPDRNALAQRDDDEDDDYDFDEDEDFEDELHDMQVDDENDPIRDTPVHMHPQALRKPTSPISIDTTPPIPSISSSTPSDNASAHDRRLSVSSTTTTSTDSHFGFASASYSTTSSSPCTSPTTDIEIDDCIPSTSTSLPPPSPSPPPAQTVRVPLLTSSFHASDLLTTASDGTPMFLPPRVPDGISLRNFGIQTPIYATLSDIVIYSPSGPTRAAFALAERFKIAIERKAAERTKRYEEAGMKVHIVGDGNVRVPNGSTHAAQSENGDSQKEEDVREGENPDSKQLQAQLLAYNVFILTDTLPTIVEKIPWLLSRPVSPRASGTAVAPTNADGSANANANANACSNANGDGRGNDVARGIGMNAVDFAQRERDEMRELTKASAILGDSVFLGNSNDVPLPTPWVKQKAKREGRAAGATDEPKREREEAGREEWDEAEDDPFDSSDNPAGYDLCIECRDYAPFPSATQLRHAEAHLSALDALWSAHRFATACSSQNTNAASTPTPSSSSSPATPRPPTPGRTPRPAPCASQVVHLAFPASPQSHAHALAASLLPFLSFLSTLVSSRQHPPSTRRKRVLIYSSDGYTESSVLALCLLMKEKGVDLPHAYLELQVEKGRSFFVYQSDLGVLKRVEAKLGRDRDTLVLSAPYFNTFPRTITPGNAERWGWGNSWTSSSSGKGSYFSGRAASNSVSHPPSGLSLPPLSHTTQPLDVPLVLGSTSASAGTLVDAASGTSSSLPLPTPPLIVPSQSPTHRRPRASTSPLPPPHIDHHTWFNDPRFDGSFPSRVLPFLYLGNLNHASNAYMLHALGITHVVSVGECALVPPMNIASDDSSCGYQFIAGKGPHGQGSLWMEEREGRIKVLDIKGVCDDGIDSLQPQLSPVCDWIDRARLAGGKVLVHCRVGVSRSATVTIAYVMKHLAIPLVDAYLIVRSRRLSVLIQPNMRLLYNLCGWEVKLARERAGDSVDTMRHELARSLNWPYLCREVHRLNEKYLT